MIRKLSDLMWVGDIVVKKTWVLLGFMFESTQLAHVLRPIRYAVGASSSSYPSSPFANEPHLQYIHKSNPKHKCKRGRITDLVQKRRSTNKLTVI